MPFVRRIFVESKTEYAGPGGFLFYPRWQTWREFFTFRGRLLPELIQISNVNIDDVSSTDYLNTFIEVADDCPVDKAEVPPERSRKTKVRMQFDLISKNPYQYTSDDLLFRIYAERNNIPNSKREEERERYFSRGRACLRSSSLGKRYGWGIHYDKNGKVAIFGVESERYGELAKNENITHLKAMRSSSS